MKAETIERYKLYYLMPSYWRKINRVCATCGDKYAKNHKVNYSVAFQQPRLYYHYECLPKEKH